MRIYAISKIMYVLVSDFTKKCFLSFYSSSLIKKKIDRLNYLSTNAWATHFFDYRFSRRIGIDQLFANWSLWSILSAYLFSISNYLFKLLIQLTFFLSSNYFHHRWNKIDRSIDSISIASDLRFYRFRPCRRIFVSRQFGQVIFCRISENYYRSILIDSEKSIRDYE